MTEIAQYPSLKGRTIFVSGGASGIGAVLVEHFARQGSQVGFIDIDMAAGMALADRLGADGLPKPMALECDVRDVEALKHSIATVAAELGPIRALVNNAARDDRHAVDEVTPDYWDECLSVNMRHHFFAAQAVHAGMAAAGGGSIINMGSISWMRGREIMIGYTTAKAAIHGMTRSLARAFGPENIRVNSLVPGAVVTERQEKLWRTPEEDARFFEIQSLKRRLDPADIARPCLFLASDESAGMTGQAMIVDAGIV